MTKFGSIPATSDLAASDTVFTPTGTVAATDVQAAIAEVASEAHGMPAGGASGTVLTKNSATDYDATWTAPSGGSVLGLIGRTSSTASVGPFTTNTTDLQLVVSLLTSAIYRVHYSATWDFSSSPATAKFDALFSDQSNTARAGSAGYYAQSGRLSFDYLYIPPASGSRTLSITWTATGGPPGLTLAGASYDVRSLWIERIQ